MATVPNRTTRVTYGLYGTVRTYIFHILVEDFVGPGVDEEACETWVVTEEP